jgi:hypothetical protein
LNTPQPVIAEHALRFKVSDHRGIAAPIGRPTNPTKKTANAWSTPTTGEDWGKYNLPKTRQGQWISEDRTRLNDQLETLNDQRVDGNHWPSLPGDSRE